MLITRLGQGLLALGRVVALVPPVSLGVSVPWEPWELKTSSFFRASTRCAFPGSSVLVSMTRSLPVLLARDLDAR